MYKKKVCMLGEFAVGKTSMVQRFVNSIFSDKYLTTVGVKIDKKTMDIDGEKIQLMLWDIQGEDALSTIPMNYVRGASSFILVVDGTRAHTLETALRIKSQISQTLGKSLPFIVLFNKCDLQAEWEITEGDINAIKAAGMTTMKTSSKDGIGVEEAFDLLTRMMMDKNTLEAA